VNADSSGTPSGLIEALRRSGDLVVLDGVAAEKVLIEFPFAEAWRKETGCTRFVRLRGEIDGARYALVRPSAPT
jgi:hypothetical protein